jgi:hypothetical protein
VLEGIDGEHTISLPAESSSIWKYEDLCIILRTFPRSATRLVGFSRRTLSKDRKASSIERVASCWIPVILNERNLSGNGSERTSGEKR